MFAHSYSGPDRAKATSSGTCYFVFSTSPAVRRTLSRSSFSRRGSGVDQQRKQLNTQIFCVNKTHQQQCCVLTCSIKIGPRSSVSTFLLHLLPGIKGLYLNNGREHPNVNLGGKRTNSKYRTARCRKALEGSVCDTPIPATAVTVFLLC